MSILSIVSTPSTVSTRSEYDPKTLVRWGHCTAALLPRLPPVEKAAVAQSCTDLPFTGGNAEFPMMVTLLGIATLVRLLQSENAPPMEPSIRRVDQYADLTLPMNKRSVLRGLRFVSTDC